MMCRKANIHVEEESTGKDGAHEDGVTSEDSVVDDGTERLAKKLGNQQTKIIEPRAIHTIVMNQEQQLNYLQKWAGRRRVKSVLEEKMASLLLGRIIHC